MTDQAITTLAPRLGVRAACRAVGAAQASYYRRHRTSPAPARPVPVPHRDRHQPRALSAAERQAILDVLHSDRFADLAPAEVWAILLDEGIYLGSQSTFYRLLRAAGETRERRRQATHPAAVKPELLATGPNQVWSWDITKLHGPAKWTYFYLYVILDIFSRYVVGWMLATREIRRPGRETASRTPAPSRTSGRAADHPRRSRHVDDLQARRVPARRPGRHQDPLPPARQQRQPVLRGAVQDPQIPAGVPRPLRLDRGRPGPLPATSSAGTTTSTATPASACTPPPTSTTATPPPSRPSRARRPDGRLRSHIPNGSSASPRSHRTFPRPPGSTHQKRRRPSLSNSPNRRLIQVDRFRCRAFGPTLSMGGHAPRPIGPPVSLPTLDRQDAGEDYLAHLSGACWWGERGNETDQAFTGKQSGGTASTEPATRRLG